jgi:hypothetical protein
MNLCVTVLVNGRGMTGGLSRDDFQWEQISLAGHFAAD